MIRETQRRPGDVGHRWRCKIEQGARTHRMETEQNRSRRTLELSFVYRIMLNMEKCMQNLEDRMDSAVAEFNGSVGNWECDNYCRSIQAMWL